MMTSSEYATKLDELDALLNDPDVPIEPNRVWELLAEVAAHPPGHSEKAKGGT